MNTIDKIKTRNELADFLEVPRKKLSYILYVKGVDNLYTSFDIPKKNGESRHIHAPQKDLKVVQKKLADALCTYQKEIWKRRNINPNISHAFQKGKSFITNAKIHRNKRFVVNIDLENFFDSFHFGRVRGFFLKNDDFQFSVEVATVIAQLSCYQGKLPQGAPCSPIITNLICNIFDIRLLKLAKKYCLDYTRYADDLTFSTNDVKFLEIEELFFEKLEKEINSAGFRINEKKTRIQFRDSRQEVTGVVVNRKLHVSRVYYKKTRAMAYNLYKTGEYFIEKDTQGTINQLEGRFSFINQLEWYNNKLYPGNKKLIFNNLNGREREYSQFVFYKYFFANPKPLIVTEGKTDVIYLKAALKSLWKEYPELVSRDKNGHFEYKIAFLRRSKRLAYFLNLKEDGADTMNNIYNFFSKNGGEKYPNYIEVFRKLGNRFPLNPTILLFDNELSNKEKPVCKFTKGKISEEQREELNSKTWIHMTENLYLLMTPLINERNESDIEMLFDNFTLSKEIDGKKFCKKDRYDTDKFYGKEIFSKYIMKNYSNIDFSGFKPLLSDIKIICENYKKKM
ncbi:MAG: RNA-directed DNA polymerase [Clostridiales bacterium]|nr:RNA-directed DNA polymerase [Clostridiales bacterium]